MSMSAGSRSTAGAAAAVAAFGAWLASPLVAMRRHGTLDEQHAAAMRAEVAPTCRRAEADAHGDALRRARVREAHVRAMAAVPEPRHGGEAGGLPRRSPLQAR
jgi:hypothetical protein